VTSNAPLQKSVVFPRTILPFSAVLFNLVLYPDGVAGAMHKKKMMRRAGLAPPSLGVVLWRRLTGSRQQKPAAAGDP